MGYRFCNFIEGLMVSNFKLILRRKYYKYFDTNEELSMEERKEHEDKNPIKLNRRQKLYLKIERKIKNVFKRKKKSKNKIHDPNGIDFIFTNNS